MNCDVHQQMSSRIQPEDLHIEHVRDPRQRMPIVRVERRERPLNIARRKAGGDAIVLRHVRRIVEIRELVTRDLRVDDRDRDDEGDGDQQRLLQINRGRCDLLDSFGARCGPLLLTSRFSGHDAAIIAASRPRCTDLDELL